MKKGHNYFKYFRKNIGIILIAIVLTVISTLSDLYITYVMSLLVEDLSKSTMTSLYHYTFVMVCVETLSLVCTFFSEKLLLVAKASTVRNLHWNLAGALSTASSETVEKNEAMSLVERLREGINFVNSIANIYNEIFTIIAGIIALIYTFMISTPIAILFIVSLSVILIIQVITIRRLIKKQNESANASDSSKNFMIEIVECFPAIKAQGLTSQLKKHFDQKLETEYDLNVKSENIAIENNYISSQIISIYKVGFLVLGGWLTKNGFLSFGNFVALFMYKSKVDSLVWSTLRIARNKAHLDTSIQRMNEILEYQKISKESFGTAKLYPASGKISIEHLCVQYGDTKVLDDLSLEIPAGKFIGIVGSSGCGKSTLLKVLARQQTPVSGKVMLDKIDLWSLDEWSYRKAITLAPQTPYLFTLSIRENLLLSNPRASEGAIWDTLEECAASEFVRNKGGLDVVITPKELSGGERQRLALARIGVKGAKIVLMDESTSALDGESQKTVIKTVKQAVEHGHTMILVAHRVSTLKDADLIVHLENGKVLESGSFSELYEKSDKFRRLADLG